MIDFDFLPTLWRILGLDEEKLPVLCEFGTAPVAHEDIEILKIECVTFVVFLKVNRWLSVFANGVFPSLALLIPQRND